MKGVRRLLLIGCALLALAAIRVVAFPILEPAEPENPGLGASVSNYSLLLWVPAVACLGLAMLIWLRDLAVRWVER